LGITWGVRTNGWQGPATGRANCALRTKKPRTEGAPATGRGGGESADPIFLRKPLDIYLRALH
jgi:hypothetical protein